MQKKKFTAWLLITLMVLSLALTSCGKDTSSTASVSDSSGTSQASSDADGNGGEENRELLSFEVYDVAANYQGIQSGWFGKLIKDKFNIELNIFAPNVSGDAEALYQTRTSSGKLGDIIILDNDDFMDCIGAGLIKDLSDDIWNYPSLSEFEEQIVALNGQMVDDGKIYSIPTDMTNTSPVSYSESDPFSAPCLPWDYYRELGFPELKNLDDLLDVLEAMQTAHSTNEDGDPAYAISLWKDWDNFGMENVLQTTKWYGQEARGSVLVGADNSLMPLVDENGAYYKMLKFFYEANRRGLIDPDSGIQDWSTVDEGKMRTYRTYLLWYNWSMKLASIGLTDETREAGKGFVNVPIEDLNIIQTADSYYGTGRAWGIGNHVDDATYKRILEFFDWMASPEGATYMWTGIEGVNYFVREDGTFEQTEDGSEYMGGNKAVPEEWGGGGFADGTCKLNIYFVSSMSINPITGDPYSFAYWTANKEKPKDARFVEWTEKYGAETQTEYFLDKGLMTMVPNVNVISSSDTTDIALTRSQCGQEITNASWKMIFAANEAEFNQIWDSMKTTLTGLDWDSLVEFDMAKNQAIVDMRKEAMK